MIILNKDVKLPESLPVTKSRVQVGKGILARSTPTTIVSSPIIRIEEIDGGQIVQTINGLPGYLLVLHPQETT
jgi:hypothetical protein